MTLFALFTLLAFALLVISAILLIGLARCVKTLKEMMKMVSDESHALVDFTSKLSEVCNDVLNNKR